MRLLKKSKHFFLIWKSQQNFASNKKVKIFFSSRPNKLGAISNFLCASRLAQTRRSNALNLVHQLGLGRASGEVDGNFPCWEFRPIACEEVFWTLLWCITCISSQIRSTMAIVATACSYAIIWAILCPLRANLGLAIFSSAPCSLASWNGMSINNINNTVHLVKAWNVP